MFELINLNFSGRLKDTKRFEVIPFSFVADFVVRFSVNYQVYPVVVDSIMKTNSKHRFMNHSEWFHRKSEIIWANGILKSNIKWYTVGD